MKRQLVVNIKYIVIVSVAFLFSFCKKEDKRETMLIDKLHILEYIPLINENDMVEDYFILGISQLDKQFNLINIKYCDNGFYYLDKKELVSDSIKHKINEILLKYPSDTTFFYPEARIYDGGYYQLIIEKDGEKIIIEFDPDSLPNDLLFIYENIYRKKQDSILVDEAASLIKYAKRNIIYSPNKFIKKEMN